MTEGQRKQPEPRRRLPPELLTLIYHVELNSSGWWGHALQRFILAALWLNDGATAAASLRAQLGQDFGLHVSAPQMATQLEALRRDEAILETSPGCYQLSEGAGARVSAELADGEHIEAAARERFFTLLGEHCPSLDLPSTWESFNDDLLVPLVRELGARTYRLITGGTFDLDLGPRLNQFLAPFPSDVRVCLRAAIVSFLDPKVTEVRAYVLRRLVTYFFIEAGSVSADTLARIEEYTRSKPTFSIFIDTNLLFSFLELHDNPANEAAGALLTLRDQLRDQVDITFYVLPDTLAEARHALIKVEDFLSNVYLTRNLALGASKVVLSGLAEKFVAEAKKPGGPTRAADYFAPYHDNLLELLRQRGVELYNVDTSSLHTDPSVVDDIVGHLEYQRKWRGERAKSYEQVQHDLTLWHLARQKRDVWTESPLSARYWVATVDYTFLAFDTHKTKRGAGVPVCLHPTALLQMLQFWVPRSAAFEQALISNLRLPFLFLDFDLEVERATVAILATVARFERFDTLSPDAIAQMLMNDTFRKQIIGAESDDEKVELVRLELIEQDAELRRKLHDTTDAVDRIKQEKDQVSREKKEREAKLADLQTEVAHLRDRLATTEAILDAGKAAKIERQAIRTFTWRVALPTVAVVLTMFSLAATVLWKTTGLGAIRPFVVATSGGLLVSVELLHRKAESQTFVRAHRPWRWLRQTRTGLRALLTAIAIEATSTMLTNW